MGMAECGGTTTACGCNSAKSACAQAGGPEGDTPFAHFARMIPNCLEYAKAAKERGTPIVGILCEYTPRELILAAGALPVCLCGGSAKTIAAAEQDLPTNLCPLIKSTYGYHVQGSNPFLEMANLIVAETTCDGKKKMYELMAERRPMYVLELPQKPDDADALEHWTSEVRKLKAKLEQQFGVTITPDKLRSAIRTMNRERQLRRELAALMQSDTPPMTGRQLLDLKSSISGISADLEQYEKALAMMRNGAGRRDLGSRIRVLLTGVPMAHGAEKVMDLIESHGGVVVCQENCTGLKPILEDVEESAEDPVAAIAAKYYHLPCSVMTRNSARMALLGKLAAEYRPDCIVELVWQACLTYDVESFHTKALAERKLGLPYLRIETDYSPADTARIAVRVEALFETALARKT
jgi:benzoyl-CoA reductase/2-hydroxyglutaryl-CoA dehydratase subunit BcrC/BadD/HgdB